MSSSLYLTRTILKSFLGYSISHFHYAHEKPSLVYIISSIIKVKKFIFSSTFFMLGIELWCNRCWTFGLRCCQTIQIQLICSFVSRTVVMLFEPVWCFAEVSKAGCCESVFCVWIIITKIANDNEKCSIFGFTIFKQWVLAIVVWVESSFILSQACWRLVTSL